MKSSNREFNQVATKLIDFLAQLERAIPPSEGVHHSLMLDRSGSDKEGWQDSLALRVVPAGSKMFQQFGLDDSDLKKPTSDLVGEIVDLMLPVARKLPEPEPKP